MLLLAACGSLQWPPSGDARPGARAPAPKARAARRPSRPIAKPAPPIQVRVKAGETLFILSRRHGVSARAIIDANRLRPPYRLASGLRLKIPPPRQYRVARGDTLYGISRRYGVDAFELARLNRLAPPYNIYTGLKLSLPAALAPVAAPPGRKPEAKPKPAAKPPPARIAKSKGLFIWPIRGRILSSYGPKGEGLHNDGINIAAPRGSPVHAAGSGTVAYAGNELRGFGNLLLIRHAGGWVTAYAHNQKLLVRRGQKVRQGQAIARVGSTGSVIQSQLHFEIRRGRRAINPARQLAAAPRAS